jgi:catechol O-methyltransferase
MSEANAKPARRMNDGREEAMLQHVLENCVKGDPDSVLNTIDTIAWNGTWMMNVGDRKGAILDEEVKLAQPQIAVEVGGYCGYSAVRIARLLPPGGHLFSLELEPRFAAIAKQVVQAAGLSDRVQHVVGPSDQSLRRLRDIVGRDHVDFFFLDHWKELYLPDIRTIEECGLLRAGTVVVADNVIYPGTPEYLAHVRAHQRFRCTFHASQLEYSNDIADGIEVSVFE